MPHASPRAGTEAAKLHAAKDRGRARRARAVADVLTHRLESIAWWRAVLTVWPGGVVPIRTAAQILAVTRQRVIELIQEGRLPAVGPMPTGDELFVPLDALAGAPTPNRVGRPAEWHKSKEYLMRTGVLANRYVFALQSLTSSGDFFESNPDRTPTRPLMPKYLVD